MPLEYEYKCRECGSIRIFPENQHDYDTCEKVLETTPEIKVCPGTLKRIYSSSMNIAHLRDHS